MTGLNQYGLQGCTNCTLCGNSYADPFQRPSRKVDGDGPLPCDVYFLGEAPGRDEDKAGKPFVGVSGQFLRECIAESGLGKLSIRIGNTARCRPPNNRKPLPEEIEACAIWTELELELAQPKVIIALGGTAISYFFPGRVLPKKAKVGDYLGKVFTEYNSIPILGSYHPAARKASQRNQIREVCKITAEMLGIERKEEKKMDYRLEVLY